MPVSIDMSLLIKFYTKPEWNTYYFHITWGETARRSELTCPGHSHPLTKKLRVRSLIQDLR